MNNNKTKTKIFFFKLNVFYLPIEAVTTTPTAITIIKIAKQKKKYFEKVTAAIEPTNNIQHEL